LTHPHPSRLPMGEGTTQLPLFISNEVRHLNPGEGFLVAFGSSE
jgi:hypothetical protein